MAVTQREGDVEAKKRPAAAKTLAADESSECRARASPAASTFRLVFPPRFSEGQPLHIARCVGTTAGQRHDVLDDVTRPAVGVAGLTFECLSSGNTTLSPRAHTAR